MPDLHERFQGLDRVPVPDLRNDIERREPRAPVQEAQPARRRVLAAVLALAVFAAAGVLAWQAFTPGSPTGETASPAYHDPAGWSVRAPQGWHVVPFDVADPASTVRFVGVQISNVELGSPVAVAGSAPHPERAGFPKDGVALVLARTSGLPATDEVPLPLSLDAFTRGGATAAEPTMDTASFAAGGWTFVATVTTGPNAHDVAIRAVGRAVTSFRFPQPTTPACTAAQLSGEVVGSEGAAGTIFVTFGLTNRSTSACHLLGSPAVHAMSPEGSGLPLRMRPGVAEGPARQASTLVLRPGQQASVVIAYSDVIVGNLACFRAGSLRITPTGDGGAVVVRLSSPWIVCGRTLWVAPVTASWGP